MRKTYQGKYQAAHPKKYIGDVNNIIYRSSWERRFMVYCDQTPSIIGWCVEEIVIPYISPKDNSIHRYFPDFFIVVEKSDGTQDKILIEVKPYAQCFPPKKPKRNTKRYLTECTTYAVNQAKWDAAKKYCKKKGWKWKVITEKELMPGKGKKKK